MDLQVNLQNNAESKATAAYAGFSRVFHLDHKENLKLSKPKAELVYVGSSGISQLDHMANPQGNQSSSKQELNVNGTAYSNMGTQRPLEHICLVGYQLTCKSHPNSLTRQ